DAARAPVEQPQAEPLLELAHLLADRARRHEQVAGRVAQVQVARGGVEGAHRVERRKLHAFSIALSFSDVSRASNWLVRSASRDDDFHALPRRTLRGGHPEKRPWNCCCPRCRCNCREAAPCASMPRAASPCGCAAAGSGSPSRVCRTTCSSGLARPGGCAET